MKVSKNLIIPCLSGFQYGYNTSIIAGALLFITQTFSLSPFQEGGLVGAAILGIWLASFSAILANYIGRKATFFWSVVSFILGASLSAFAPHYALLFLGRMLVGLGAGAALVIAPIYLVEVAPVETRGRALNLNQIGIALGSLIAYLCSYLLSFSSAWRAMLALALLPAFLQLFGLFSLPESLPPKAQRTQTGWKNLLSSSYLPRFKLVIFLSLFPALSGANALFFFAPRIFEKVGFSGIQGSLLATLWIGCIYLLAILFSFWAVDKWGRRPLLLTSFGGMGASLLFLAFFGWANWPGLEIVSISTLLLCIAFFAVGVGPIPPLVVSEISPLPLRGHAMTVLNLLGWSVNYLIALTFLPMMDGLSAEGVFALYGGFCLLALLFFSYYLPETKQKSLEEMERLF